MFITSPAAMSKRRPFDEPQGAVSGLFDVIAPRRLGGWKWIDSKSAKTRVHAQGGVAPVADL